MYITTPVSVINALISRVRKTCWFIERISHVLVDRMVQRCCFVSGLIQVACMQFINIVVHSVEDMNFRVHLQYDFTKLCLDDYLDVSWLNILQQM